MCSCPKAMGYADAGKQKQKQQDNKMIAATNPTPIPPYWKNAITNSTDTGGGYGRVGV